MPDWYPSEELERHGLTPDDWNDAAVYCLALETPGFATFCDRWDAQYDVTPPESLLSAVDHGRDLAYVGKTNALRTRLADHVDGDVRVVKLLRVCPPTGVAAVWFDDEPGVNETQYAYAYSHEHPETLVACNGEYF